ncbi:MAG: hypothetical protein WCL71_17585 [Deltaproteobacteria bacterium]
MNNQITKIILAISFTICVSGCGISPYRQEVGLMFVGFGGYYDSKLDNGNYGVSYASGHAAFHNTEKVRDFALRRACDLTIEKGANTKLT